MVSTGEKKRVQINPYRSVRGGSLLLNRLAVLRVGPAFELWKKDPRFCLESNTVGGLASSGTIDDSSTEGGGISSDGEAAEVWFEITAVTAVVGKGRLEEARLSNDGRASSVMLPFDPRMVAVETVERRLLPIDAVAARA